MHGTDRPAVSAYETALADWFRSRLPRSDEWSIRCRFSSELGHSVEASHPLSLGISWSDYTLSSPGLADVEARYGQRLSSHPEALIVAAEPPIQHPALAVDLRRLIGSRLWVGDEVYDLCSTLANDGVISTGEAEWLTWYCSEGAPMAVERPINVFARPDPHESEPGAGG